MQRRDRQRRLASACKPEQRQSHTSLACQLLIKENVEGPTDEFVDLETDLVEESRRLFIIIRLGGSLGFLLKRLLDVISLGSEFLGLSGIVSDKDVVDFKSALYQKR
jgi:hypothetical protein